MRPIIPCFIASDVLVEPKCDQFYPRHQIILPIEVHFQKTDVVSDKNRLNFESVMCK